MKGVPEKKILRRMKYISDQKGIMNRYLAEGEHWEEHLQKTRSFVLESLEGRETRSIAIMGSGWLLDLPLEQMAAEGRMVYLVDIVQPPQIVNKVRKMKGVELITADITGGAVEGAYRLVRQYHKTGKGSVLDIACQAVLPVKADFLVSLNILNQLDILLLEYIERFMSVPDDEKSTFRRRIQEQHLGLLEPGRSCLITDVEERAVDREGRVTSAKNLVYSNLPEAEKKSEWTWNFDTRGEYNKGRHTEMLVRAICL